MDPVEDPRDRPDDLIDDAAHPDAVSAPRIPGPVGAFGGNMTELTLE